jgi:ppGpp synthetase/RelA/SpoT-type nucleotidyltranferase
MPPFSADEINWAASIFRLNELLSSDLFKAIEHVNNWRDAHQGVIAHAQVPLMKRAESVSTSSVVASRLKRLRTIMDKCLRLPRNVELWDMQDVGGLRAILATPAEVYALQRVLDEQPLPQLKLEWSNDYIREPKRTGYRSLHRIYSFVADSANDIRNGLRIEIQLRSLPQHFWATSNEIVSTFRREDLKSNRGSSDWRRYFTLAGSLISIEEGMGVGPNVPEDVKKLAVEFQNLERKLNAFEKITSYSMTPKFASKEQLGPLYGVGFVLLVADLVKRELHLRVFGPHQFDIATSEYRATEKEYIKDADFDVVLVRLDDLAQLEQAYPNYWAHAGGFLNMIYPDWDQRGHADF